MTLWYLARAAGVAAMTCLALATTLGALMSVKRGPATLESASRRYVWQTVHRSAAAIGLALVTTHVILMVVDQYANVSVLGAAIPFTAGYRPLAVGLGTIALLLFATAGASGAARGRLAASERYAPGWRRVHALAYAGWALSVAHAILAGTDALTWWFLALLAITAGAALVAIGRRLLMDPIGVLERSLR